MGAVHCINNGSSVSCDHVFALTQLVPPTIETIELAAQTEGLILDPVYTGKTMAGFIHRVRQAGTGRALLFVHTSGTPALFGYATALDEAMGGTAAGG